MKRKSTKNKRCAVYNPRTQTPISATYLNGRYGTEVGEILYEEFHKFLNESNVEFEDAFRVCQAGIEEEEKVYEETITCCGFADKEIVYNGITYRIGFNHGH